jgi:hypothetical protein
MAKKFSDFAVEERPLQGDKIKMVEVLGKKILIKGYRLTESKFPTSKGCLALQIEFEKKDRVLFTGSGVLISQIKKYEHEIPFETTITQPNKYYTFS